MQEMRWMVKKAVIHATIVALLVCASGIATGAPISIRFSTLKKHFEKKKAFYEYAGTVSYSPTKGEPSDVTLEAYFLYQDDDYGSKRGTVDVVGGTTVGTFDFGAKALKMQKFKFTSPRLEKDFANQFKGVLVRAVANGQFLAAASYPIRKNWICAARDLAIPAACDDTAANTNSPSVTDFVNPEYAEKTGTVSTNIFLMTEWAFDQRQCGCPQALINDEVKCPRHATTHIIPYDVVSNGKMDVYANTLGYVEFTMSINNSRNMSEKCKFRCWDQQFSVFDAAPNGHRASVTGRMSTIAKFRIYIDTKTGKWTLLPCGGYVPSGIKIDAKGNVTHGE